MNEVKYVKQFLEVMHESRKTIGKCVSLEISNSSAALTGLTKSKIDSLSALVVIRKNGQVYCKGCFDGEAYESSSIDSLDPTTSILIGIDLRSKGNMIYYKSGKAYGRVSTDTRMNSDEAMYLFWECGPNVCLIVGAHDPELDEVIVEIVSVRDEPMKRFLKAIIRQLLLLTEIDSKEELEAFDFDNDSEEEMDHDSWGETTDY